MTDITITPKKRKKISLDLGGVAYSIKTPKTMTAITAAKRIGNVKDDDVVSIVEAINDYLVSVFGERDATTIMGRLDEDDDDLEIEDISQLIKELSEFMTDDPTT